MKRCIPSPSGRRWPQAGRKTWWANGNLRSALEFENGKTRGVGIYCDANGHGKTGGTFEGGKFSATAKWDENGESVPLVPGPEP